ncbi:MAG: LytTR family DNA-binding domain-containing protein [Bacteroidales bacterium]|nr:LytTR family DNA-binding domain-containing protein [Clostridium sp.]MCM1203487.1 LytTR family DNA-binding domain-containing protein [Bacteroidales bacterium]
MAETREMAGRDAKENVYIVLCDDDKDYLDNVANQIKDCAKRNRWKLKLELFTEAEELLLEIQTGLAENKPLPDIVFMDIKMSQMDGIAFGRELHKIASEICLVFITAYAEYAIDGYQARAYRYLLKPVQTSDIEQIICDILDDKNDSHCLIVKTSERETVVKLQDIIYMSAEDKYTVIHTTRGDYLERSSLNALEKRLGQYGFNRIHRKYLVNMWHHKDLRNRKLYLTDNIVLPVSRRRESQYRENVLQCLEKGLMRDISGER